MKAGDLAVKEERWSEAAGWYSKANPDDEELVGRVPGGATPSSRRASPDRGAAKMQLAALSALSPDERALLAGGLVERGLREQGAEQFEIVRRTALPHSPHVVQAAQQVGNLVSRQEPRRAVRCWRQLLLHVLNRSSNFTETEGYLTLPHVIHKVSARAALAEGDIEACERQLAACAAAAAGRRVGGRGVGAVARQVQGARTEATALFEQSFDVHHAVCLMRFPKRATSLNNTAWLAARSQRKLDEALALVERALAIAPDEPAYLDTLAEVHFQRGDREAAVAAARRAAELVPASDFARQRLAHFETSEPKTLDAIAP
jgi:tetratricopeptide (TPR) repeat protein